MFFSSISPKDQSPLTEDYQSHILYPGRKKLFPESGLLWDLELQIEEVKVGLLNKGDLNKSLK